MEGKTAQELQAEIDRAKMALNARFEDLISQAVTAAKAVVSEFPGTGARIIKALREAGISRRPGRPRARTARELDVEGYVDGV